ncbi:helix-turn-helix domain-containing protein [Pseudonocardia kujensis]|uniref:IclR family transcriptional regulator n=1 Tax=Pseudonocardia kujensis TaxID=1128675 RepID=UPI001E4DFD26|nr:IclR family transcriptional regulator C-terminal domain-containing protein [Pseudonocardia kujensis]MCE0764184.1 helix-turn-helix domain-containing protein [Pseudonocardia kujensis]
MFTSGREVRAITQGNLEYHRPAYAVNSIDNALRAIHILRDFGSARISDVAKVLGVADSTAHRIMAMLVFHGFAVQDDDRRYRAGPALSAPVISSELARDIQELALPTLGALANRYGETVCLATRVGVHTRVLVSAEPEDPDHVPERTGNVLPAHLSAAGRALLALLPVEKVEHLYRSTAAEARGSRLSDREYRILLAECDSTRRRGFSLCLENINKGISAVAVAVTSPRTPPVAIVVSTPAGRLVELYRTPERRAPLFDARDELAATLALKLELREPPSPLIA